jgi:hypothetical protein
MQQATYDKTKRPTEEVMVSSSDETNYPIVMANYNLSTVIRRI